MMHTKSTDGKLEIVSAVSAFDFLHRQKKWLSHFSKDQAYAVYPQLYLHQADLTSTKCARRA
jgi:hypothetical protein